MKDKLYNISRIEEGRIIKESELTRADEDLLLGNLIREFLNSPEKVKIRFRNLIIEKGL